MIFHRKQSLGAPEQGFDWQTSGALERWSLFDRSVGGGPYQVVARALNVVQLGEIMRGV